MRRERGDRPRKARMEGGCRRQLCDRAGAQLVEAVVFTAGDRRRGRLDSGPRGDRRPRGDIHQFGLDDVWGKWQYHDLGKLMFAFTIFWSYMWYSQFLPIWYGNLGRETMLAEGFTDDELRWVIQFIGMTADQWDDQLKRMFGGSTSQEALASEAGGDQGAAKPGGGTGLYL